MKSVTPAQASQLRAALEAGRARTASLSQLAAAHDLAVSLEADQVAAELRARLHAATAVPSPGRLARDLALGVVSGALTHHLMRST